MPFESKAQERWAHTAEGTEALGGKEKVEEWQRATDSSKLPEKKKKPGPKPRPVKRIRHTTRSR